MNIVVVLFLVNLIFFGAVAYYLSIQRKQLQDQSKLEYERREHESDSLESKKEEYVREFDEIKDKAEFILSESEKLAQELIVELQQALGKNSETGESILPDNSHLEEQLGFLKEKIKKQYASRISHLVKQLENVQMREARKVEKFAQEQEATTDVNLQKIRVEELEKMHQRIENYKNGEIALFNDKVKKVVIDAAQDYLGHSLTIGEQEELVTKAVRKAREEHVL